MLQEYTEIGEMPAMSWIPIAERFTAFPLILSGPILRRVEPQSITVWLALKEPCTVTLRVYVKNDAGDLVGVPAGERLHDLALIQVPDLDDAFLVADRDLLAVLEERRQGGDFVAVAVEEFLFAEGSALPPEYVPQQEHKHEH